MLTEQMVFADDQGSMKVDRLQEYGFRVLIDKVGIPDLSATGPDLYRPVHEATLLIKEPCGLGNLTLQMAVDMVMDYQHNGFGVPLRARMVNAAIRRLEEKAAGTGFVPLS